MADGDQMREPRSSEKPNYLNFTVLAEELGEEFVSSQLLTVKNGFLVS